MRAKKTTRTTKRKVKKKTGKRTTRKSVPAKKTGTSRTTKRTKASTKRRPVKKERFSREELVRFERALLEEKQRILKQRDFTKEVMDSASPEGTGDLSSHRTHSADQGTENYQRELASRLRSIEGMTLREIDDALKRIAAGTFGTCTKCGKPVTKARLKVVPHARFCMKCLRAG